MNDLSLRAFRAANERRLAQFPGHAGQAPWSPADWMVATVGELGELANMLKKIRREVTKPGGTMPTQEEIENEFADVLTYLDLLAMSCRVDLAKVTTRKFNKVSTDWGLDVYLPEDGE